MGKELNGAWLALGVAGAVAAAGAVVGRGGSMARRIEPKHAPEDMVEGYLQAALLSSTDYDGKIMGDKYGTASFTLKARKRAVEDCDRFLLMCRESGLENALFQNEAEEAGRSFWYARNDYDTGFSKVTYGRKGNALAEIARNFPGVYLVEANRGKVGME